MKKVLLLLLFLTLMALASCVPPPNPTVPGSAEHPTVTPVTTTPLITPNPKLGGFLNDLIEADKRGEAKSFAEKQGVTLIDGRVKVEIEVKPGGINDAVKVVSAVGTVGIVLPDNNLIQAVVPISSLSSLAMEESIRFILRPIRLSTD